MTYEDLTPEQQAEADRNPIVVNKEEDVDAALNESHRTGRPVEVPSMETAREWGFLDEIFPEDVEAGEES
jgi:hypothetical protein